MKAKHKKYIKPTHHERSRLGLEEIEVLYNEKTKVLSFRETDMPEGFALSNRMTKTLLRFINQL